ncbi:MAG: RDD family protein [Bacteriovoracia bacterium]
MPVGFWKRFVAAAIDGLITTAIQAPFLLVLGMIVGAESLLKGVLQGAEVAGPRGSAGYWMFQGASYLVGLGVGFLYHGYFYSARGATPGKMIFDMVVVDTKTGQNLDFFRAGLRDTLGKLVSAIPLMIGYIMAGVRGDKRALHDLIFGSQVVQRPPRA